MAEEGTRIPKKITWAANDRKQTQLNPKVIWGGVAFFVLLSLVEIWTKNYLGFLVMAVILALIIILRNIRPKMHQFEVNDAGIKIDNEDYYFTDLSSFWILYDPPLFKDLVLKSKKALSTKIVIPLGQADPVMLHRKISEYLPEKEEKKSLIDLIGKILGI
ncbi:MAG: hypothetical protein UT37_C0017G0011 [Parcubacteria group bacterium GW2011_GWA2_39_18]|nr:MAG: hypothetical protein UT37_C0017G0011 [Parcubacteria group bacterium GW2011_GWA2_39_18]